MINQIEFVRGYTRADGTKVRDYYRVVLRRDTTEPTDES